MLIFNNLFQLAMLVLLAACTPSESSTVKYKADGDLVGKVHIPTTCRHKEMAAVTLHEVNGTLSLTDVSSTAPNADGSFRFSANFVANLGGGDKRLVLRSTLCNGDKLERVVTAKNNQDLSYRTTLAAFAFFSHSEWKAVSMREIDAFTSGLPDGSDREIFTKEVVAAGKRTLHAVEYEAAKFAALPPIARFRTIPEKLVETQESVFEVEVFHWDPSATLAVKWEFDNKAVGSDATIFLTPNASSQGNKDVVFTAGFADPSGVLDLSRATVRRAFSYVIADTANETVATNTAVTFTVGAAISVAYGSTGTVTATLTNGTTTALTGVSISSVASPWSLTSTTCTSELATSSSCNWVFTFASPGVVSSLQELTVSYNGDQSKTGSLNATGIAATVSVEALYSGYTKWNEWIVWDTSKDKFSQTTVTACSTAKSRLSECIHTGEKKKIVLTYDTSCSNLVITDTLGAFRWKCSVVGGAATVLMVGLKDGKGLRDLVSDEDFRQNSVTVTKNGVTVYSTSAAQWWTNSVVLTNGAGATMLDTQHTIYVVEEDLTHNGFSITANNVSLVTLAGKSIKRNAAAGSNCRSADGEIGIGSDKKALLCAGNQNFLWVEVKINANNSADYGIFFHTVKLSTIRDTTIVSTNQNFGSFTVFLDTCSGLQINRMRLGRGGEGGLKLAGVTHSTFTEIYNYSSGGGIVLDSNSSDNTFSRAVLAGSSGQLFEDSGDRNTLHLGTMAFSQGGNVGNNSTSANSSYSQLVLINTETVLLNFNGSDYKAGHVALMYQNMSGGGGAGIRMSGTSVNGNFSHAILAHNSGQVPCMEAGGATNAGLVDNTCVAQNGSTNSANVNFSSFAGSFVDLVTSDGANTAHTNGVPPASGRDFMNFDNFYRGFLSSSAFGTSAANDACSYENGIACQIRDLRLKTSDTVLRNKSGDGSTTNETFTAGSACPATPLNATTKVFADQQSGTYASTYMLNAYEIYGDSLGDDDGLCESNEACIYQPNFGAYLGEGDYLTQGTCTFTNGSVSNVEMYAYPTNGG